MTAQKTYPSLRFVSRCFLESIECANGKVSVEPRPQAAAPPVLKNPDCKNIHKNGIAKSYLSDMLKKFCTSTCIYNFL